MELYDTYDENGVFQFSADDSDVHYKGLWHKVVRVWLYDQDGNIYLRVRKSDNKLDCINELHIRSSESAVECFDRGMYEKLGIHFSATSQIEQAYQRKKQFTKVYSDNTEIKDNYFLCDYIGEFDNTTTYFLFSDDTAGLVKVNARGIANFLSIKTGEIIGYEVNPFAVGNEEKRFISIADIYDDRKDDLFLKYNFVTTTIIRNSAQREKVRREDEKIRRLVEKTRLQREGGMPTNRFKSHADENEGTDVY